MYILSYDVETANNKNVGSICAIGWVLLENDNIIDKGYTLINPNCTFSKSNINVHGIKEEDVINAPLFSDYWNSTLSNLMKKSLVIAHSAGFDMAATEQALYNSGITDFGITYIDSIPIISTFFDCESYKLCDLASLAGYSYNAHHAEEDAMALVYVLKYLRDKCGFEDIASLIIHSGCAANNTSSNTYEPKKIVFSNNLSSFHKYAHCKDDVVAKDNCLSSLRFCITGDIPGYEREEVEKIILEHNGKPTSSVSGKTDYLIVGEFTGYESGYISGKMKKAMDLIEQGGKIQIIHPDAFFAMIKQNDRCEVI